MPANAGTKAVKTKLTLVATGTGGEAKAKLTLDVEPASHTPAAAGVSTAFYTSCALLSTSHIACWGSDELGTLGDGATANTDTGVEVHGVSAATEVSASGDVCALLSTGHIQCWGQDFYGSLGDDSTGPQKCSGAGCSTTPVEVVGITDARQVGVGEADGCAVLSTGHVDCWGMNRFGALGDGTYTGPEQCESYACSLVPVEVHGISTATQVSVGTESACAVLSTGSVDCWGVSSLGELGDANSTGPDLCAAEEACSTIPVEVQGITTATQVSAGSIDSCVLLSSGHVDCWGYNGGGELGDGAETGPEECTSESYPCSTVPVEVTGMSNATEISVGNGNACAVLSTHGVDCWGVGDDGLLGDGGTSNSDVPAHVESISTATDVSTNGSHACALLSTGGVDCWGSNVEGELGTGSATGPETCDMFFGCSLVPVEVKGL